jgi:hypothetical protein
MPENIPDLPLTVRFLLKSLVYPPLNIFAICR